MVGVRWERSFKALSMEAESSAFIIGFLRYINS